MNTTPSTYQFVRLRWGSRYHVAQTAAVGWQRTLCGRAYSPGHDETGLFDLVWPDAVCQRCQMTLRAREKALQAREVTA